MLAPARLAQPRSGRVRRSDAGLHVTGWVAVPLAAAVVLMLAACGGGHTVPTSRPTVTIPVTSSPSATPTPTPTFLPKGTAGQNLPYFDAVNQRTLAAHPNPVGRDFIDGLVAAGFDKSAMLVTADKTTINLTPGSIQFSVALNGGCLIGQYGSDGIGYHSETAAPLATGKCLVGDTSPITW